MKISDFASEFELFDPPPDDLGSPMTHANRQQNIAARGAALWIDESLMNLLANAVYSFYFAKRACPSLEEVAGKPGPLAHGLRHVRDSLLKGAVISVATAIDTTGRTRSLPHALDALADDLKRRRGEPPDNEIEAALQLLTYIRAQTQAESVASLRYVRHLRNTWAGHSSLDRTVDGWAGADKTLDFRMVEDALVRVVNAFQDLSELVPMSKDLQDIEAQAQLPQQSAGGTARFEMKIAWSGANALSEVMRAQAQRAADTFIETLRDSAQAKIE